MNKLKDFVITMQKLVWKNEQDRKANMIYISCKKTINGKRLHPEPITSHDCNLCWIHIINGGVYRSGRPLCKKESGAVEIHVQDKEE